MRVTLVIHSLGGGGAEHVMTILANAWAVAGRTVALLTLVDGAVAPFYDLHPAVEMHPLGVARPSPNALAGLANNGRRLPTLRAAIRDTRPDVVVSFMNETNVLVLAATRGLRVPVIVSERNDPARRPLAPPWRALRRLLYPRAARLVVQSEAARGYFPEPIRRRACIIPNPVPAPPAVPGGAGGERSGGYRLIAAGRLVPQKGFDLLLDAFADVAPAHPAWTLTVFGEGGERAALEARRRALGLAERVAFPGATKALGARMRRSDLFVLSSRYEGFPNVLCEAMAAGLPVVSFDCPSGPADVVRDGIDGVLVPPGDVPALARTLGALMGDPARRWALAARAPEVLDRFGLARVMGIWDDLLREVTA